MSVIVRILRSAPARLLLAACGLLALMWLLALPGLRQLGLFGREVVLGSGALAILWLIGRFLERRNPAEFGLPRAGALRALGRGAALGALLISLTVGLLAIPGWYRITGANWAPLQLLRDIALFLAVAVFEETLFRGLLFRIVEEWLGSWVALAVSAGFFGIAHLFNPAATAGSALAIALEAGVLLGGAYMATRNLWFPIGIHWAWNLLEGPIFGTEVSGTHGASQFLSVTQGPVLWTGGGFGPEAGLVCVMACTVAGIGLVRHARRAGQIMLPVWWQRRRGFASPA